MSIKSATTPAAVSGSDLCQLAAGDHAVAPNLYLCVKPTGTAAWVLRYVKDGARIKRGLGSCDRSSPEAAVASLSSAMARAAELRGDLPAALPVVAAPASPAAEPVALHPLQELGPGTHLIEPNLYLVVVESGAASWKMRYGSGAQRRVHGLGACDRSTPARSASSLASARLRVAEARARLLEGVDPVAAAAQAREMVRVAVEAERVETQAARRTLRRVVRQYHEEAVEPKRSLKHAQQWINSIEQHLPGRLLDKPIRDVTRPELFEVLVDLARELPETGARVRQRLRRVFNHAVFQEWCDLNAMEAVSERVKEMVDRPDTVPRKMLPFELVPDFYYRMTELPGDAALALRLLILTSTRSQEARGARFEDFDLAAGTWLIPGTVMKAGRDHLVFLCPEAIRIVEIARERHPDSPYLFPVQVRAGKKAVQPVITATSLAKVLDRESPGGKVDIHGFRSSFSTWANEGGKAREVVIESCLAHADPNKVRAAYNRAEYAEEKAALWREWGRYVTRISNPARRFQVVA